MKQSLLFFSIGFGLVALAGCSTITQLTGDSTGTATSISKHVNPSRLPAAVVRFVDKTGQIIGDGHPAITSAKTDVDDATQKPSYDLVIQGSFRYHNHHASRLHMFVLADGSAGEITDPSPENQAFDTIKL